MSHRVTVTTRFHRRCNSKCVVFPTTVSQNTTNAGWNTKDVTISFAHRLKMISHTKKRVYSKHSQNNSVLCNSLFHFLQDLDTMSQSLIEVATFSEHAKVGAPFYLTDHSSTRVDRDCLCQLCDGRFHVFKVLWTVPVDLVFQESHR